MKKVILGIFSIFLGFSAFCSAFENFTTILNKSGIDYLCFTHTKSVLTGRNSQYPSYSTSRDYYSTPFKCGSFSLDSFNESFVVFPEMSGFLYNVPANQVSSFRFYNKGLTFVPGLFNYTQFGGTPYSRSFLASSLTNYSIGNAVMIDFQRLYQFKINYDNGEFLNFGFNNLQGYFNNNYYFSGVDYSLNNNGINSFYMPGVSISSVYKSGDNYLLQTIFNDGYSLNSNGKIISFNTNISGLLVIPLLDFGYNYLTGSKTLVLKELNGIYVYNILDCFSSKSSVLRSCSIIDRGYFNDFEDFFNHTGYSFTSSNGGSDSSSVCNTLNTYTFYYSGNIVSLCFGNGGNDTYYNNIFSNSRLFELTSNSFVFDILSTINFPISSGEVVDILDTLCNSSFIKPIFCNGVDQVSTGVDGFWDLDGSGNLIYTLINTDPNNMGWGDITPNGSGGFNVICSDQDGFGCPLLENAGLSGYLDYGSGFILGTDYYETFFQKTGRFFACPYGYVVLDTNSFLKILNKFNQISESIGFDFMLPINCSIAAFTHGKNYKFLKDVNLGLNPLMGQIQGPDDPRVYLYRFFDFLMSIALLFFLLKLYHLIF